jgi:hypothetical protein
MATTTGGRIRTVKGCAVLTAIILVVAFGNPAYTAWAKDHTSNDAWGFFLKQLAWPTWSFSSNESVRTILANDLEAILLIVLTGVLVSLVVDSLTSRSANLFFSSWGAYVFAGAFAGLLAAFLQADASLRGSFNWPPAALSTDCSLAGYWPSWSSPPEAEPRTVIRFLPWILRPSGRGRKRDSCGVGQE